MTTNEDKIEGINEEFDAIQEAKKTSNIDPNLNITHQVQGEEEKKREKLRDLSNALGLPRLTEDIDNLNKSVSFLAEQSAATNEGLNKLINHIASGQAGQGVPTQGVPAQGMDMEKIEVLGRLAESLLPIWQQIRGPPAAAPSIISQDVINQKMMENFMDNIETGESITKFIKDSLKKKVTKEVVNTALGNIGNTGEINHAP